MFLALENQKNKKMEISEQPGSIISNAKSKID